MQYLHTVFDGLLEAYSYFVDVVMHTWLEQPNCFYSVYAL